MSERVIPARMGGLNSLDAADALWADLMAASAVPTVPAPFTCSSSFTHAGYVLLGSRAVTMSPADGGQWAVAENEVRRSAAELSAMKIDSQDLVRIGPFRGTLAKERSNALLASWRQHIIREVQEQRGGPRHGDGRLSHLVGIDWRRIVVERVRDDASQTWWLPRAVVRLLDAAAHAEGQWLQTGRTRREATGGPGQPDQHGQSRAIGSLYTANSDGSTVPLRAYTRELEGQRYTVLSRKPSMARKIAGWTCAVCHAVPAAVLDHCHEHGYVRAPVCHSCNTQERPDHLYSNDIRVAGRYTRLFDTDAAHWLRHWHRCTGRRARTPCHCPTSPHGPPT